MEHIIGTFIWEKGSINDNIRNFLSSKHIPWWNTFNGDVETDIYGKVKARCLEGDEFAITFMEPIY